MAEGDGSLGRSRLKSFHAVDELQHKRANEGMTVPRSESCRVELPAEMFIGTGSAFITYSCVRQKKMSLLGARYKFCLKLGSKILFEAKYKQGNDSYIPIIAGEESPAALLYGNKMCSFSLRKDDRFGEEMISVQVQRFDNGERRPRVLRCAIFGVNTDCPAELKSTEAVWRDDAWEMDLNNENALTSIKNCRLDEPNGHAFCYVRKMGVHLLELEVHSVMDPLRLFAIGIGSYLCKR